MIKPIYDENKENIWWTKKLLKQVKRVKNFKDPNFIVDNTSTFNWIHFEYFNYRISIQVHTFENSDSSSAKKILNSHFEELINFIKNYKPMQPINVSFLDIDFWDKF